MIDNQEKSRLAWRCRRGMLELDLILQDFLADGFKRLNDEQLKTFEFLLGCTDPELLAWFMGHEAPQDVKLNELVALIRATPTTRKI